MNYLSQLREKAKEKESIICMGMDPLLDRIPEKKDTNETTIYSFYEKILNEITQKNIFPACVKPNYAYYAQYGIEGINALYKLIKLYRQNGLPVILDVKRGDIGTTAKAYAFESFDFFQADAVTLSPYMGYDSISPFIKNFPNKGYYILCKTSNPSSDEVQNLDIKEQKVFHQVAQLINKWFAPGIGAVTGATYPEELESILKIFKDQNNDIPLLIPGIGAQGGDLEKVLTILKENSDISLHRINSSSGINYAWEKNKEMNFAQAAVEEIKKLNEAIISFLN